METGLRLIVRGDDAGSCASADRALVEAHRRGILRNVSVMAPGPTFPAAAALLRDLPGLCLGLHVTLNAEWDTVKWGPVLPAAQVPALVDERGLFLPTPTHLHERQAPADQMLAEVQAQLDRARAHGLNVQYLDEHMCVSWLAGLRDGLARLAEREGLVDAGPLARPLPAKPGATTAGDDLKPDLVHEVLARVDAARAADDLAAPYVLVTHPGYVRPDMRRFRHAGLAPGQVARDRAAERRLLLDPRLRRGLAQRGVEVVTYVEAARRSVSACPRSP